MENLFSWRGFGQGNVAGPGSGLAQVLGLSSSLIPSLPPSPISLDQPKVNFHGYINKTIIKKSLLFQHKGKAEMTKTGFSPLLFFFSFFFPTTRLFTNPLKLDRTRFVLVCCSGRELQDNQIGDKSKK